MPSVCQKYRFLKKTAKNIKEHFEAIEIYFKGSVTKNDFRRLLNQFNPFSERVLDAFFFSPDDLNPGAEAQDSIDLEHFFKMIHLFFLFPTKRSLRDCRDIFTKPKQVFAESKNKKKKG